MANRRGRKRWHLRIVGVALALAVIAAVAFVVTPRVRRVSRQRERMRNLRVVVIALHDFYNHHRVLPGPVGRDRAGRALCSWRRMLLLYMEPSMMLGVDFSRQWDDPANRWESEEPYPPYCWSNADGFKSLHTNVVAVTGPGTAFDGEHWFRLSDLDADTILLIEIADFDTHWMEPGDLSIDAVPESIVQGMDGDGVHVAFADASVWFLRSDVPLDDLKKFFTIDGAKQYDREEILGPYAKRRFDTQD